MSNKNCQLCGKTSHVGNTRSHSNIASKRRFKANLQTKKVGDRRLTLCTQCVRTQSKKENSA